ncbi:hypothetical protein GGR52DRAFT_549200 [Hypoxylon sp. FL1284]|nr:hypothetical protein GGR52DRAFT_549200 [Hypoxylon sp. FL1284]
MASGKRARPHDEMSKETSGKDYAVCDQCRIKKIRCGREKPFCSNCTRLGHQCEWSGNGKKCNQTVLLSNTIEGMSRRLESLEASLAETQDIVNRLVSGTTALPDAFAGPQTSSTWPTPTETTCSSHEPAVFKRPIGHFLRDVQDNERYFNPTSLGSLMYDVGNHFLEPLISGGSENQSVRHGALLAQHRLDELVSRDEEIVRNGVPPTAPPVSILRAMIEPYFEIVNPHFPIWTKESFVRMATTLEDQDLGLVVCSNNLIFMTLAANTSRGPSHQGKLRQAGEARNGSSSINVDLMNGFLTNAKRGVEFAELLLSPRLINVQALLSLCVIAQDHMSPSAFARLFNMTAQCAKSIGIHDWERCDQGHEGDESTQERQRLSYCLYVLDKVVFSTIGTSPCIRSIDVHIDTPANSYDEDRTMNDLIAKAKLAEIQETIYLEIYSCRAPSRTASQVPPLLYKLDQRLQDWLESSRADGADASPSLSKIELSIAFASTQLLYMRPFKEHPDVALQITEVARGAMKLLLSLWRSPAKHRGTFPHIIASYPPLYLFEVYAHVLCGDGQESDTRLLQSFNEMLHSIAEMRAEESHHRRLYEASTAIMAVVAARNSQYKRRKTHHISSLLSPLELSSADTQRLFPHSPSPDAQVSSSSNEQHTSPRTQCGPGGTAVPAISISELLMSPANSRGRPEDELTDIMDPLGKDPFELFDLFGYTGSQIPRGDEKDLWWDDRSIV